jgi:hypothetical protein
VLTDPFDVVFTGDVAHRVGVELAVAEQVMLEYRVFLHECLQTGGLVVAPNGWLVGAPADPLADFLTEVSEDDLVELAPPEAGLDFDELSYGIALAGDAGDAGDDGDDRPVAFWLPTFGGALIVPAAVAAGRRIVEPLYARLALVVRLGARGVAVDDEIAALTTDTFWEVAGEHVELRDLAPVFGARPLAGQVESWVVTHLDRVAAAAGTGALEVEARPLRLEHGRTRMPLALRHDGGWLLVDIRPGTAGLATLARVERALSVARAELADDARVEALLLAEDATPELVDARRDRGDVRFAGLAGLLTES